MGTLAAFLLGGRDWLSPALAVLGVAVLLLVFVYWRTEGEVRTKWLAAGLKLIGLGLLVLCLIEPMWSTTRAKPGENLFLIVADNSASLSIQVGAGQSRGEWEKSLLTADEAEWQVRLAQDFAVRRYQFAARVQSVTGFDKLDFTGDSSELSTALTTLGERYTGQPLAGILLVTDGNGTGGNGTGETISPEALKLLPPVYPIVPPQDDPPRDLSITELHVTETVFEDAPVTVRAEVTAHGMEGEDITAQLLNEIGRVVDEQTVSVDSGQPIVFRFQARPDQPGLTFYTVRVAGEGKMESAFDEEHGNEEGGVNEEATLANNLRRVAVNRKGAPYRILYVAGRPNWEYKYLRRGVQDDPQIELIGLLRIANREAKFEFRGRADESSNPLFRGFKKEGDEETESYDQPVIIRLGTKDEAELRDGFPKVKAELFKYDAVILDDIEAAFFTHDQLSLIERFVSERGGGLMMLGGRDTFRHGEYSRTPVADALPVYLDRSVEGRAESGYRFKLTREGWLEPWMRLRSNESDEKARLSAMPAFQSVSRVDSVKPAARVLATVTGDGRVQFPAIVTQRYGRGRTMAVLIGDLWRWGLKQAPDAEDDLAKSWRQMVRWLIADVPDRLETTLDRQESGTHRSVKLAMRMRSEAYQPQDNANLTITVRAPDGSSILVDAEPSLEEAGLFHASFTPKNPGVYRAEIVQTDDDGQTRSSSIGWSSDPSAEEFRRITVNHERLSEIAESTGGEVVAVADLNEFVATLPTRKVPLSETWLTPLWHRSWMFLLVLLCLVGEWGVRRLRGLP